MQHTFFTLFLLIWGAASATATTPKELADKSGATVKGYVLCGDRGIADVVVSDGQNVTSTDTEGRYWLKTKIARADFVMISTPRGYEPQTRANFLPVFYYALDKNAPPKSVQRFDFHLTESPNDNHMLFVVADEHVSGRVLDLPPGSGEHIVAKVDSLQFRDDFMPQLVDYAQQMAAKTKIYGLNLGDMTHSEYWFRNKTGMPHYLSVARTTPFQMYHVIGNHDHCHKFTNDREAEEEYRHYFGPTYYSFNLGKIHYVVLDDMLYKGRNTYDRILAFEQLDWLRKDLKAMDPAIKHIVLAAHVPLTYNSGDWKSTSKNLKNWDELFLLIEGYRVTILSGDWHTEQTVVSGDQLVEYIHPAITGNWWYRQGVSNSGGPAAFVTYDFSGDQLVARDLVDWSRDNDRTQYTLYNKGITTGTGTAASAKEDPAGDPAILVNFWSVAPNWTFVCREDGELTYGRGGLVKLYDPQARSLNDAGIIPTNRYKWLTQKPIRLFRYAPRNPNAQIEIIATDHLHNREHRVVTRIEN